MKSKNLFLLPSVLFPVILSSLVVADGVFNRAIDQGKLSKRDIKDLIMVVVTCSLNCLIRYSESEDTHTPRGLPGRDAPQDKI